MTKLRQDIHESDVDACRKFPPTKNEDLFAAAEVYANDYQDQFEQGDFEGCLGRVQAGRRTSLVLAHQPGARV